MSQDPAAGLVTPARPVRPRLTSSHSLGLVGGAGRALHIEAPLRRLPSDAGA